MEFVAAQDFVDGVYGQADVVLAVQLIAQPLDPEAAVAAQRQDAPPATDATFRPGEVRGRRLRFPSPSTPSA